MGRETNPVGKPRNTAPVLREPHLRFIGAALANGYSVPKLYEMLVSEFMNLNVAKDTLRHYQVRVRDFGAKLIDTLKERQLDTWTSEQFDAIVKGLIPKVNQQSIYMLDEYAKERLRILADPTYGVTYADKRQRMLKVNQNIDELDEKKVFMKGSYPTVRNADGSTEYKEYELANKDHAEQRKHLQVMGDLTDGAQGGDVNITIIDNLGILEETEDAPKDAPKQTEEGARSDAE